MKVTGFASKALGKFKKKRPQKEVTGRGLEVAGNKKEDYQKALTDVLRGQCRVPAFLFHSPAASLEDLGLSHHEILPCEPMHDISNYINNLLEEYGSGNCVGRGSG